MFRSRGFATAGLMALMTCWACGTGFAEECGDAVFAWCEEFGKVPMTVSDACIGIRFGDGVPVDRQKSIMNEVSPLADGAPAETIEHGRFTVMPLPAGKNPVDVSKAIAALNKFDEVTFAAPCLNSVWGDRAMATDRFYVSFGHAMPTARNPFPDSVYVSREQLDKVNKRYGVDIVKVKEFSNIDRTGYWLRLSKHSDTDAAHMAVRYIEELHPLNAGPALVALTNSAASPPPNDSYYDRNGNGDGTDQYYLYHPQLGINVNGDGDGPYAWDFCTGAPEVIVAVIDAGVALKSPLNHFAEGQDDLVSWINKGEIAGNGMDDDGNGFVDDINGWNFTAEGEGGNNNTWPLDYVRYHSHGTQCAGVAAAMTNNDTLNRRSIAGIAGGWTKEKGASREGCPIMAVVAYDGENCFIEMPELDSAIRYASENGAGVMNISRATYIFQPALYDQLLATEEAGAVCVAAAGNHDAGNEFPYPAAYSRIITVGALNNHIPQQRKWGCKTQGSSTYDNANPYQPGPFRHGSACTSACGDKLSCWGSNYGYALDLMAPSLSILTTDYTREGACYGAGFGKTSAATPQVTGAVALILSAIKQQGREKLWPSQIQAILQFSATDCAYLRPASGEKNVSSQNPCCEGEPDGECVCAGGAGLDYIENAGPGRDRYTGYGKLNVTAALTLALKQRYVVKNSQGEHCFSIDSEGNMTVESLRYENASPANLSAAAGNAVFKVQDAKGEGLMLVELTDAHLYSRVFIKGRFFQNIAANLDAAASKSPFHVEDESGHTVAFLNAEEVADPAINPVSPNTVPAGSMILKGRCFFGGDPDSPATQGL